MSKGGGGTGGMEDAIAQSNALQEKIYNEGLDRGEPWYQAGTEGLGTLLDYMGLQGGKSSQSRSQIYDELAPQFTTQTQGTSSGNLFKGPDGSVRYFSEDQKRDADGNVLMPGAGPTIYGQPSYDAFTPVSTGPTETTDTAALNAAIEQRLQEQTGNQPEYFGSLLQSFGEDQFEVDPGYQFRMDEGNKALERQLAAQGKTFSPEAAKELMRFNQGLGAQEYQNAYNRYNMDQGNIYNRLAGIAGLGQQQIAQQNALGANYADTVSNNMTNLANAKAAAEQSKGSMFDGLLKLGGLGVGAFGAGVFG